MFATVAGSAAVHLRASCVGHTRCAATRCIADAAIPRAADPSEAVHDLVALPTLPAFPAPLTAGLPTSAHVDSIAELLVDCFYSDAAAAAAAAAANAAGPPGPSGGGGGFFPFGSGADEAAELPASLRAAPTALQDRWRMASKGLHWRLGARLEQPTLEASLETSLMLVLQEGVSGPLVGCVELALRPTDGKLPGEFAVPPLFMLHTDASLGAYLSNLAVRPSHRRQGVATRLLEACEAVVRHSWRMPALYLHVDEHNAPAANLYRARGYECLPAFDDASRSTSTAVQHAAAGAVPLESANGGAGGGDAAAAPPPVRNRFHRKLFCDLMFDETCDV